MLNLIIDTSTERGLVAIAKGSEVLYSHELPFGYQNAQYLFPAIEEGLRATQLQIQELSCITACIGPGSYTGIRVGAMVAKSLSYASKVPLLGINTLKGFVPNSEGCFAVLIDAKIAGCYLLSGESNSNGVSYHGEAFVCPLDSLEKHLKNIQTVVTPFGGRFTPLFPDLNWEEKAPCPSHLSNLAMQKYSAGNAVQNNTLELCYLR